MNSIKKTKARGNGKNLLFYLILVIALGALILCYISVITPVLTTLIIAGILFLVLIFWPQILKVAGRPQKEG